MNKILAAAIAAAIIAPASAMAADAKSAPSVKIGGGIQADYRLGDGNDVTTAAGYGEHEFNMRRARLTFSGKVNELIGFGVTLQGDNTGGTIFRDMFGTLNFNPLAKVTVGQFKYEFDLEGRESSFDRPFMDRTNITNAAAGGASGDFRDKGVQLSGAMDMGGMGAGYALGIFQGNGGTNSVSDAGSGGNNNFMYTANLFVAPVQGAKINAGYMNNDNTADNTTGAAAENKFDAWTVGAAYDVGPILARAEYYNRKNQLAGVDLTTKGWYVMGGYTVLPDLDLLARYQTMEVDEVDNSTLSSVDLGAKYYFARKGKRGGSNVAVNYMIRDADANAATTLLNDGRGAIVAGDNVENVLAARLQVAF
ncbi:MAG: porin [Pseudomonadota bacterium]|uniref:porin n=1 Tax=Thermithiobacillus tepidarius TaxID=929 RepID=UPI000426AD19|nr:porin [Thermithiobacillus tepidarius]